MNLAITGRVAGHKSSPAADVDPAKVEPLQDDVQGQDSLPLNRVDRNGVNRRPRPSWWIWLFLAIAIIAAAVIFARFPVFDRGLAKNADVLRGNSVPAIEKVVSLGRLEPEGEVIEVAGPNGSGDARIAALKVDVGDQVEAGQILAVLDNHDQLHTQLVVAQKQVDQARVRLQQSRLIASTTYAQLRANLEAVQSQRETFRAELRRHEQLRKNNASSLQEYEATLLAFTSADKAVTETLAKLARYADPPEASIDVQLAEADVLVAEASLQNAAAQLERSFVRAPNAGRVLAIDLRPGERISQRSLLRMGNTATMLVRAEVYESDVAKIRTGELATIHATAFTSPLSGVVQRVGALVQRQSIVDSTPAANTDARVVEVLVRVRDDSTNQAARFVGMQVTVEMQL